MSEHPAEAPPDPVASENGLYEAVISEYVGLRRAGGSFLTAAVITAAHLYLAQSGGAGMPGS